MTSYDGVSSTFGPLTDSLRLAIDETESVSQTVVVNASTNTALGGTGNDILMGATSNDTLSGGAGHDLLVGGPGSDTTTGGVGVDVFAWSLSDLQAGTADVITDFKLKSERMY